jgi:hypothetical protein
VPSAINYKVITSTDKWNESFGWRLEPHHTHFLLFDDETDGNDETNNVKNMLLKRQEIEHELSISQVLRSPVIGYQPKSTSMYCQC